MKTSLARHQLVLDVLLLLLASAATVYAGSGSSSKIRYVPVRSPTASLFHPGATGLVKVVQSGYKYGNLGSNGLYGRGKGNNGGYVYYDQLPSYGKGYSSGGRSGHGYYSTSNANGYGGKGYIYYDQLPSYSKGRNRGYDYYGDESNDYYDNSYYGYYGNDGYGYGYYGEKYPTRPRSHRY
ncbi:hypothetical protein BOX15_Mlig020662g1 [Macrostomum lignano]|uniref:Uncharacterized protein n=1 Tax=Macrostomum lignano TaxID=282301 RepID=A0A267F280_9PLAT|nr:hypothetical protein BOX15_Mlig020662g2 [Macrostomum lignano]PAA67880.1 hypothetical protein BOX15_Mlig020662g1 [Macrostomum lignano]